MLCSCFKLSQENVRVAQVAVGTSFRRPVPKLTSNFQPLLKQSNQKYLFSG